MTPKSGTWTPHSLRVQIIAVCLLLVILPMAVVGTVSMRRSSDALERQSLDLQNEITARVSIQIAAFVNQRLNELRLLDEIVGIADLDVVAQKRLLQNLLGRQHNYHELLLVEPDGRERIRISRSEVISEAQLGDRSADQDFRAAVEQRITEVGAVHFDPHIREPMLPVAIPFMNRRTGSISVVLMAHIRFTSIWSMLGTIRLPNNVHVFVVDENGSVVAHKEPSTVLRRTTVPYFREDGRISTDNGAEFIVASQTLEFADRSLTVLAAQPVSSALQLARSNAFLMIAFTLVALLLASFLTIYLLRQIVRPIEGLAKAARAVSGGNLDATIHSGGKGEFGDLAWALRTMVERLKATITNLDRERERVHVTLRSIGDAVIATDQDGIVTYLNPVAEDLTGWHLDQASGHSLTKIFNIISEDTRQPIANPVQKCIELGQIVELADHTILVARSGVERSIQESAAPIRSPAGEVLGVVLVFRDVSEARQMQKELSYRATHDWMTGLISRQEFERKLGLLVEKARSKHETHTLCYLDLDQFKLINDTCGHAAGDELLRQVTVILQKHVRHHDVLGRLGGDEFGVLMEDCSTTQALRLADAIRRSVADFRFAWGTDIFSIGVSIGLASIDTSTESASSILKAADSACYSAKKSGRNRVQVYRKDDGDLLRRHDEMQWVTRIPSALESDSFELLAQPIRPIGEMACDMKRVELLLRFIDDDGSRIMPAEFLSAAERYNLAVQIDRWVVEHATAWLSRYDGANGPLLCSINLSGQSLGDESFLVFVNDRLDATHVSGNQICFEITETAAIANLQDASRFMKSLKRRGCIFALDDFGSGLSSFAYLKTLPVDIIKIDGVMVKDITHDPLDLAIVRSINEIGQLMGMQTVAKFVESQGILTKLEEIGVNWAQGYHLGRPEPLIADLNSPQTHSLTH